MADRALLCATCGKKRGPLEQRRDSWSIKGLPAMVPRRDDVDGKPWQQTNDLIIHAAVYRNGGTSDDCHLCDDCLRIGLRKIKAEVDEALGIEVDHVSEIVRLTDALGHLQHATAECGILRVAGIPSYAWNHQWFVRACSMIWFYFKKSGSEFLTRFGDVPDIWTSIKDSANHKGD